LLAGGLVGTLWLIRWVVMLLLGLMPGLHPLVPQPGITDSAHVLPAEHSRLTEALTNLNAAIQGQTYVMIAHPLQAIPTVPLPHLGVWLAYDPQTHTAALQLGQGLRQPPGTISLLGTSPEPLLADSIQAIANASAMPPAQAVHVMLVTLGQTLAPHTARSQVVTP
jgi:hypothetical protein